MAVVCRSAFPGDEVNHQPFRQMKRNPLEEGMLTEESVGIGTVTRRMMQKRAVEIAFINGRSRHNVLQCDWEQAKRELTGGQEMDPKEAKLESAPEAERWDPVPGSEGHKVPEAPSDDEDREGRSDNERLVEEGIEEAEHDQMLRAANPRRGSAKSRKLRKRPS